MSNKLIFLMHSPLIQAWILQWVWINLWEVYFPNKLILTTKSKSKLCYLLIHYLLFIYSLTNKSELITSISEQIKFSVKHFFAFSLFDRNKEIKYSNTKFKSLEKLWFW
jgi:hypothetical protein